MRATSTTGPAAVPIQASWKISQVLDRYPALLEELISLHPAFGQLRRPLARRVQARLVTVEQAARIAGMNPEALVAALNLAIGAAAEPPAPAEAPAVAEPVEPPACMAPLQPVIELDVRPLLRRGEEPFHAIMDAARSLPDGHALRLRTTFEPIPLYGVLGRLGFDHWARQLGPEEWEVLFCRSGEAVAEPETPSPAAPSAVDDGEPWPAPDAVVTIDVSELVPPEPMIRILQTLEELPPGARLLVRHVRRPIHLYPRLDEMGCHHRTRDLGPGRVELLIEKPAAEAAR